MTAFDVIRPALAGLIGAMAVVTALAAWQSQPPASGLQCPAGWNCAAPPAGSLPAVFSPAPPPPHCTTRPLSPAPLHGPRECTGGAP